MGIKKICIASGSRAESGILYWLMKEVQSDPELELQTLILGTHLSPEFGMTENQLIKDGFPISERIITTFSSDEAAAICKSIGVACLTIPDALIRLKPDWLVLLGDRYEMLATAICAYTLGVPVVHLHGGEATFGLTDEGCRHSITKMSSLHFASTIDHAKRIIQLGENPKRVFNFGAPGIDHCYNTPLLSREELSREISFNITSDPATAIVTYHPVTLEEGDSGREVDEILAAITQSGIKAIFTKSNADAKGRAINTKINDYCQKDPLKYIFIDSLGSKKYFSALKCVNLMIGNTSSGIIESGSFSLPVVNIGDRQQGRTRGKNTLEVLCKRGEVLAAIKKAIDPAFQTACKGFSNPYEGAEKGKISLMIKEQIKKSTFTQEERKKVFHDVAFDYKG